MKWTRAVIDTLVLIIAHIVAYQFVRYDNKRIAAECTSKKSGKTDRFDTDQRIE